MKWITPAQQYEITNCCSKDATYGLNAQSSWSNHSRQGNLLTTDVIYTRNTETFLGELFGRTEICNSILDALLVFLSSISLISLTLTLSSDPPEPCRPTKADGRGTIKEVTQEMNVP